MSGVSSRLNIYLRNGLRTILDLVLLVCSFLVPKRRGLWCFGSYYQFTGNSKYLYLHVAEHSEDIDPVWVTDDQTVIEQLRQGGHKAVHSNSLRGILTVLRAEYAFGTHNMGDLGHWSAVWFRTNAVSLAHGTPMMEATGSERNWKQRIVLSTEDFVIVTSEHAADALRRSRILSTQETVLATGYPQNDALFREFDEPVHDHRSRLETNLPDLNAETDLLLYLPTKRGHQMDNPLVDEEANLRDFDRELAEMGAHLVIKRHPSEPAPSVDADLDNITVLDSGVDIHTALPRADLLITDFSSVYLPYLLFDRPIVFFPYDFDRFTAARTLLYDYDDITPGPKVYEYDRLVDTIQQCLDGSDEFANRRSAVKDRYHRYQDGESCERVSEAFKTGHYAPYVV